jgi:hypothetical protein
LLSIDEVWEHKVWGRFILDDIDSRSVHGLCTYGGEPLKPSKTFDESGKVKFMESGLFGDGSKNDTDLYWTANNSVTSSVPILKWTPDMPFTKMLADKGQPTIIRGSVVSTWSALNRWSNMSVLAEDGGFDMFLKVKQGTSCSRIMDTDKTALMTKLPTVATKVGYAVVNLTTQDFLEGVDSIKPPSCMGWFKPINEGLREHLVPDRYVYLTEDDWEKRKQFVWVSTPGCRTHTHFDQDYNFFIQLVGQKRFTFFPPKDSEYLHPYPRSHPLWHKSQMDYHRPNLDRFTDYARAEAREAVVEPGDVLYLPPYWWHHVETLSNTSVSLSTMSHDTETLELMEG